MKDSIKQSIIRYIESQGEASKSRIEDHLKELHGTTGDCASRRMRITDDIYDSKLKRYKEDQRLIELELQEYTDADEQYHITAKTILSIAKRALDIFIRSEVTEKQQFLGYFLQNAQLNGSNLEFTL